MESVAKANLRSVDRGTVGWIASEVGNAPICAGALAWCTGCARERDDAQFGTTVAAISEEMRAATVAMAVVARAA